MTVRNDPFSHSIDVVLSTVYHSLIEEALGERAQLLFLSQFAPALSFLGYKRDQMHVHWDPLNPRR